jgi:hypothetical protein
MDVVCIGVRYLTLIGLLFYGMHLANEVSPYFRPAPSPGRFLRFAVIILAVRTYASTMPRDYRHQATAALLFSFPGTLVISSPPKPRCSGLSAGHTRSQFLTNRAPGYLPRSAEHLEPPALRRELHHSGPRRRVLRVPHDRQHVCRRDYDAQDGWPQVPLRAHGMGDRAGHSCVHFRRRAMGRQYREGPDVCV